MKAISDYLENVTTHIAEGRNWSPVYHSDLYAWQSQFKCLINACSSLIKVFMDHMVLEQTSTKEPDARG